MTLINNLKLKDQAEVVVACDTDPARGRLMEEEFGIPNFTTDFEEIVEAGDVDLVLIATPMAYHAPMTLAALAAGKHVLVEKPMGVTLAEGQQLVEAAKQSPGHLVVAPHVLLSVTYQEIWRHIQKGDVGRIHLAPADDRCPGSLVGVSPTRGGDFDRLIVVALRPMLQVQLRRLNTWR
jgi:predicted dehydrogenase